MPNKILRSAVLAVFTVALLFAQCAVALSDDSATNVYSPCKVPPQISASQLPNCLLLMDFSGSMQSPAYCTVSSTSGYSNSGVLNGTSTDTWTYDYTQDYYGPFDTGLYYKYNDSEGYFQSVGDKTTAGTDDGKGNFDIGVYGNILNWILVSRTDASMKAMIGGKAYNASGVQCSDSDVDCYVKMEGAKRTGNLTIKIKPGTTVQTADPAVAYIRPSTWTSSDLYSDNWQSSLSTESFHFLDIMLTSTGQYVSTMKSTDSQYNSKSYQLWSFTLNVKTRVNFNFMLSSGKNFVGIIKNNSSAPATGFLTSATSSSGTAASISNYDLDAGTWYVMVAPNDTTPTYPKDYTLKANVTLTPISPNTGTDSRSNQTTYCPTIGGIANARCRVKINAGDRIGAIQKSWDKARWGFMFFNGDSSNNIGRLLVRCGELTSKSEFCSWMSGDKTSDHTPWPVNGTPMGEAFKEVKNYFKQSGGINSAMFTPKGQYDPYYTSEKINGAYQPVPCRQSNLILVSDGNWSHNSGGYTTDPAPIAYDIHWNDLRTDLGPTDTSKQTVNVFTIFAFSTPTSAYPNDDCGWGENAMQWIAMYGGFSDLPSSTCKTNWPYPQTSTYFSGSTKSTDVRFSTAFTGTCQKAIPDPCCEEWDANPDMLPGDGLGKGVPDNYFYVKNGAQIKTAIEKIVSLIDQQTASSSAVATLAQKTGEGDIVIRAMYEATPPACLGGDKGSFLWYGHLEAYWPNPNGSYDFELYPTEIMCKTAIKNRGSSADCWDAARSVDLSPTGPWKHYDKRTVFTYAKDASGNLTKQTFTDSNALITAAALGITGATTDPNRTELINWVLGKEVTTSSTSFTYRSRTYPSTCSATDAGTTWVLGDIVYSTPVVSGPPTLGGVSQNTKAILLGNEINVVAPNDPADGLGFKRYFLQWRQITSSDTSYPLTHPNIKYRDKVVYVGGNDGMLHAFLIARWDNTQQKYLTKPTECSDIGTELWAYIPSNYLDQLRNLAASTYGSQAVGACSHRFMVDLAPRTYEICLDSKISTDGTAPGTADLTPAKLQDWPWRTVVIGGERGGGDMYFALDVTDPYNPQILWEYSVMRDMVTKFNFDDTLSTF